MNLSNKIAKLFGYELVRRSRQTTLDSHIMQLIAHCRVNLVLDVGANNGGFGKKLRQEGYRGEIHSFEPVSGTFEMLQRVARNDHRWLVHKLALGDTPGRKSINITASSDFSSFLDPSSYGRDQYKETCLLDSETVDVDRVDNFLAAHVKDHAERRIFLKMDTQGYDLNVFGGASRSLPSIACMLSELSLIPIYAEMPHYLEALRRYEDQGFAVTGIFPVSRMPDLSVIEMDCTLIKKDQGENG